MEIFYIVITIFIVACVVLLPTLGLKIMKRNALATNPTVNPPKSGKYLKFLPYLVLLVGGTYLIITRVIPLLTR